MQRILCAGLGFMCLLWDGEDVQNLRLWNQTYTAHIAGQGSAMVGQKTKARYMEPLTRHDLHPTMTTVN